ncbi:MAG TPA: TlpA disulfide reductase family protein, partial [Puia sp.]|nr:TlpA disulfide reductase family protein [Puia sp.]
TFREKANLFLKNYGGDSLARIFGENYGYMLKNAEIGEKSDYQSENLTTPAGSTIAWKDILSRYNGKIVYVDFWASWGTPCIHEIPYSHKLYDELKKEDIAFLYISEDVGFKTWLEAIPAFRIPEKDAYLIHAPLIYSRVVSYFNIVNIPRYLIFDKKGMLVKENAPHPSNPEVRQLLTELAKKN